MNTEARLMKDPSHAETYQRQIEDMLERGVAKKLDDEDLKYDGPVHYISRHEVLKQESASTRCRIVFNASANYKSHVSNEYWAKGPDLLGNLLGILVKFREGFVAYFGDVKKMYHTIRFDPDDQQTNRFMWRDFRVNEKPEEYMMQVVSFGDRPAATIAQLALRKTPDLAGDKYNEEKIVIYKSTYMDDIIDSVKDINVAKHRSSNIEKVLLEGSLRIKNWIYSGRAKSDLSMVGLAAHEKVLGLYWNLAKDVFEFQSKIILKPNSKKEASITYNNVEELQAKPPPKLTRRQALSQFNSIYDPLGLAAPFIVKAKILTRETWNLNDGSSWDEHLPERITSEWLSLFGEIFEMSKIDFRRCITPIDSVGDPMLVIFSDASEAAYGAAAYVVWTLSGGSNEDWFLLKVD